MTEHPTVAVELRGRTVVVEIALADAGAAIELHNWIVAEVERTGVFTLTFQIGLQQPD